MIARRDHVAEVLRRLRSYPGLSASMQIALTNLRLSRLFVVHSGTKSYPLGTKVHAVPLQTLAKVL